jgi:hypothetical protein
MPIGHGEETGRSSYRIAPVLMGASTAVAAGCDPANPQTDQHLRGLRQRYNAQKEPAWKCEQGATRDQFTRIRLASVTPRLILMGSHR